MIQALKTFFTICLIILIIPIGCSGGRVETTATQYQKLSDVPDAVWKKLNTKKIFFGHQSVGYNILDGIRGVTKKNSKIALAIEETYDPDDFKPGTIAHSQIGYNTNPKSKLDMFAFILKSGGGEKADIAMLKFCYVDITAKTDVVAFFKVYKESFNRLTSLYPRTTFIHMTAPLTTIQTGPKTWIKKLIGRPVGGTIENRKRNEFNEMIRKTYIDGAPVFDIAAIESTYQDGSRASFELDGEIYYYLIPDYTTDGGHLNETGARKVAEQLLLIMAEAI